MKITEIIVEGRKNVQNKPKNFSGTYQISKKLGGGYRSESRTYDDEGKLTKYKLVYINPMIYSGDNGRVLGYDNADGVRGQPGRPHRHFMGKRTYPPFTSFEDLDELFQEEWLEIAKEFVRGKNGNL